MGPSKAYLGQIYGQGFVRKIVVVLEKLSVAYRMPKMTKIRQFDPKNTTKNLSIRPNQPHECFRDPNDPTCGKKIHSNKTRIVLCRNEIKYENTVWNRVEKIQIWAKWNASKSMQSKNLRSGLYWQRTGTHTHTHTHTQTRYTTRR